MKKLFILFNLLYFFNWTFGQFDLPRRAIFRDLIADEDISLSKNMIVKGTYILDANTAIYKILHKDKELLYSYSEYDPETKKYRSRYLKTKVKILNNTALYTEIFKMDQKIYGFRHSQKGNKINFYLDELVNDDFVINKTPLYEWETEEKGLENRITGFHIDCLKDRLVLTFLKRNKGGYDLNIMFFDAGNFSFINKQEKSLLNFEIGDARGTWTTMVNNDVIYGLFDFQTWNADFQQLNYYDQINIFRIGYDENIVESKPVDLNEMEFVISNKMYVRDNHTYLFFNSIKDKRVFNKIYNMEGDMSLVNKNEIDLLEFMSDFYDENTMKNKNMILNLSANQFGDNLGLHIYPIKKMETVVDEKGNLYFFGTYTKEQSINNDLNTVLTGGDLQMVKVNSKNEIEFSKRYIRSLRYSHEYEIFPELSIQEDYIKFGDYENNKYFKDGIFQKEIYYKPDIFKGSKYFKISGKIDPQNGNLNREILNEAK